MTKLENYLNESKLLHVQQVLEGIEIFLNWETRNKYRIMDESQNSIAFAAEKSSGLSGVLFRQLLGHWRAFSVTIFDEDKHVEYELDFPFRFLFKTMSVKDSRGVKIGHLQQRFAIFRKKFDVFDKNGRLVAKINSSFFRFWTFEFLENDRVIGKIQKKWSGALTEYFTDRDNFKVSFRKPNLDVELKGLMLATCLMVDIIYFEKKG